MKNLPLLLLAVTTLALSACRQRETPGPSGAEANATGPALASPAEPPPAEAAPADSTASAPAAQPARSARAQRFEELLRAPLPEAIPTGTNAAKASARTGEPSAAEPPGTSGDRVRSSSAARAGRADGPGPRATPASAIASAPVHAPPPDPPVDDGSDVVPPVLLSASFEPQRVEAGKSTSLTAVVSDERSGVRSVSGILRSPTGTMQGFSGDFVDTNRFVARVMVPDKAAPGTWVVQMLTIVDNAGNRADLHQAQGALPATASFEVVSSAPDEDGPVLRAVWLDRMTMRGGERNTLFVDADDNGTGIAFVHSVFLGPAKLARIGSSCRSGTGGVWECPLAPAACIDCGSWRLETIQLQDRANNSTSFRADHALIGPVHLEITGERCDSTPPHLTSIALDPPVVSSAQESTVTVYVTVSDEGGCGPKSLSGQMIPPDAIGGQRATVVFRPDGDGRSFTGRMTMQRLAAKGVWTFAWLEARDEGGNMRVYNSSDPALAGATLRVE